MQNVMSNSFNLFYYFLCHVFLEFYFCCSVALLHSRCPSGSPPPRVSRPRPIVVTSLQGNEVFTCEHMHQRDMLDFPVRL